MVSKNIVRFTVCVLVLAMVVAHPSKRQINTDEIKKTDERICGPTTPCGWAVYNKLTRYVEHFMKNKCNCMDNTQCVRDEEDISINSFVYRCKIKNS